MVFRWLVSLELITVGNQFSCTKKPSEEGLIANSLTCGVSAVKVCISRTRRKYITIFLSRVKRYHQHWLKTPSGLMVRLLTWGTNNTTRASIVRMDSLVGLIAKRRILSLHSVLVFEIKFLGANLLTLKPSLHYLKQ